MRMHRGSSKGGPGDRPPENLPLSASPLRVRVTVEVARAGRSETHELSVDRGTLLRAVVRQVGQRAEGCAVLVDGTSVPLDTAVDGPIRLTVIPTFSGG